MFKKTIVVFLSFMFVFSPAFAVPAQAQWVVFDPAVFGTTLSGQVKDYGLDSVAWMIVNLIIERIAASTVNWINSGFKGSPAYVTDPESYFQDLGDKIAGQYILTNPNLNFLCGPISAKIRLALATNYIRDNIMWRCTLTDVYGNMEDFMDDFERGGWDKFFELTQRRQNSPIGAYLQAENEMYLQINTRQENRRQELLQGSGFLSFRRCKTTGNVASSVNPTKRECIQFAPLVAGDPNSGKCIKYENVPDDVSGQIAEDVCIGGEEIVTPGSVIQNQLNKTLGIGSDKLAVADEINEIVSALLNQLINKIVGTIGSGLRSLSRPDSTSGGQTFTSRLSNSTAASTVDYFGTSQNTDVLNQPIPDPYTGVPDGSTEVWPTPTNSTQQPFQQP